MMAGMWLWAASAWGAGHFITGQVIDRNGQPVNRAVISLAPGNVKLVTDREGMFLIDYLRDFIRCASPNPPGDTLSSAAHVRQLLDAHGVAYEVVAPNEVMPNLIASFEGGANQQVAFRRNQVIFRQWSYPRSGHGG